MKMTRKSFLESKPFFYQDEIYMYHNEGIQVLEPMSFSEWSVHCEVVEVTETEIMVVRYLFDIQVFKKILFKEMERIKEGSGLTNIDAMIEKNKDADLPF